jgi:hypothetical protein
VIVEGAAPVTVAVVIDVEAEVLVSIRYPADPAAATTATIAIIDTDRIGSYAVTGQTFLKSFVRTK